MEQKENEYRRLWTTEEARIRGISEETRRNVDTIRSDLIGAIQAAFMRNASATESMRCLFYAFGGSTRCLGEDGRHEQEHARMRRKPHCTVLPCGCLREKIDLKCGLGLTSAMQHLDNEMEALARAGGV